MAHDHHMYMLLADGAARQYDLDGLLRFTPRLEELAVRDEHRLYLGIAHRAWGVAHRLSGEYDRASERLDQAQGAFRGLGTRWQIGRTLFEMGEVELARGEKSSARNHFALALEAFEGMKAKPDAEQARAALDRLHIA